MPRLRETMSSIPVSVQGSDGRSSEQMRQFVISVIPHEPHAPTLRDLAPEFKGHGEIRKTLHEATVRPRVTVHSVVSFE